MTDRELLAKKLAFIETCVADLRRLARPAALETDLREERFIEHTLQLAIQAAQDVASHIVADERLGEPRTNRDLFTLLARGGWIAGEEAELLGRMAGFRKYSCMDTAPRSLDRPRRGREPARRPDSIRRRDSLAPALTAMRGPTASA